MSHEASGNSRRKEKLSGKILVWLLATILLTNAFSAQAQQSNKVRRIGFLFSLSPAVNTDRIEAFRQGLRELGYMEGKNIVIEYRYAEGKRDLLNELAAELARLKVDVIVSGGPAVTRPAKASNPDDSYRDGAG